MASKNTLTQDEKKVLSFWGLLAVIVIIILFVVSIFFPVKTLLSEILGLENEDTVDKYILVTDYSRFSTVSTAINKYYTYVNAKDYESALTILDANYVKKNNITYNNFSDYMYTDSKSLSFEPGTMYYKESDNDDGKFYYAVEGMITYLNSGEDVKKDYYLVILDGSTMSFSISPIEEKQFNEVEDGGVKEIS